MDIIFLLFILTGFLSEGLSELQHNPSEEICGPLKSLVSEENHCIKNDIKEDCPISSARNTVVVKQCRPYYSNNGQQYITYTCEKYGEWNSGQAFCEPECGDKRTGATALIVGGEETEKYEFPWVAAIYVDITAICGGTIITPYHVLSAAHCYTDYTGAPKNTEKYIVRAGKHYRDPNHYENATQERKIKNLIIHDDYKGRENNYYDISLIEVNEPFILTSKIRPVCIDWSLLYQDEFRDGSMGTVTGWGFTKANGPRSEVLRKVDVLYRNQKHCHRFLPVDVRQRFFSTEKFCAGYMNGSKGICHGDAGAGFYFKSQSIGKYFIMGIASTVQASESGCTWNHYAIYTKISNYVEWLKTTIGDTIKFPMRFETRVGADTLSSGCTLPNHIPYGKFSIFGMPFYAVNERVSLSSKLTLNCDNGTTIDFFCIKDEWLHLNGTKCRKPGTCHSVIDTESEYFTCILHGSTISCVEPPSDTRLAVNCKLWYMRLDDNPYYCGNGSWDREISPCIPECGKRTVDAAPVITGGVEAEENEHPWVVIVYNSNATQICSGTIISRNYIISAAHCFTNLRGEPLNKNEYTITAGKHFRDKHVKEKNAQELKIKSIEIHPSYKGRIRNYVHDIALIELEVQLMITSHARPICIDWENSNEEFDFISGTTGVVFGWGKTGIDNNSSPKLKKLIVPYQHKNECIQHFTREFTDRFYSSDKFCAGYVNRNESICQGDSGGGLAFNHTNKFYIRGVASLTPRNTALCDPNIYALYTKVSSHISWIDTITWRRV